MAADNSVLLDRTRHRKIDYETNKIYHIPAKDAKPLCPTIEPLGKDGKVDAAVMARWAALGGGGKKNGSWMELWIRGAREEGREIWQRMARWAGGSQYLDQRDAAPTGAASSPPPAGCTRAMMTPRRTSRPGLRCGTSTCTTSVLPTRTSPCGWTPTPTRWRSRLSRRWSSWSWRRGCPTWRWWSRTGSNSCSMRSLTR